MLETLFQLCRLAGVLSRKHLSDWGFRPGPAAATLRRAPLGAWMEMTPMSSPAVPIRRGLALLLATASLALPAAQATPPVAAKAARVAPADQAVTSAAAGFSPQRLQRIDAVMAQQIAQSQLAGGIVYIARDGRPVHAKAYGQMDIEGQRPMAMDTIFRIASMSKALTSVAVMMLYEEGHFLLRDPVAKFIPAFAQSQVAVAAPGGQGYVLEKLRRPISIRDLLRHTAGLTYGSGLAAQAYKDAGLSDWYLLDKQESLAQLVDRLAALPLHAQPGEQFQYGYATDVLGRLVEVVSGMPLDRFIETRITGPLGMKDTHFFLPPEKAHRLAHVYGLEKGQLVLKESSARSDFINGPRQLLSGGAGMLSTAPDYARFLQMLLNGGELDGVRLLSPKTVALMTANHTGDKYRGDGDGFGLGFWVTVDPGVAGELGTPGSYGWGSAYFPQYFVDPKERLLMIFMTQLRPAGNSTLNHRLRVMTYQALIR